MNRRKTLAKVLARSRNIRFDDAIALAKGFGFQVARISGSHHIPAHPGIPELLNLQEVAGCAKPYQLKQLLNLVERYNLSLEDEQ